MKVSAASDLLAGVLDDAMLKHSARDWLCRGSECRSPFLAQGAEGGVVGAMDSLSQRHLAWSTRTRVQACQLASQHQHVVREAHESGGGVSRVDPVKGCGIKRRTFFGEVFAGREPATGGDPWIQDGGDSFADIDGLGDVSLSLLRVHVVLDEVDEHEHDSLVAVRVRVRADPKTRDHTPEFLVEVSKRLNYGIDVRAACHNRNATGPSVELGAQAQSRRGDTM